MINKNQILAKCKEEIDAMRDESERTDTLLETINTELTDIYRTAGYKIYGMKEINLNQQYEDFPDQQLDKLSKSLKRINRAIATAFARKERVRETKVWQALEKNDQKWKPYHARRGERHPLTSDELDQTRADLKRIQKNLIKEKEEKEREITEERIAKYIADLDNMESDNPKNFFKRANIDKKRTNRQQTTVTIKEGEEEKIETEPAKVMIHTFKYWQTMFRARAQKPIGDEPWFETDAQKLLQEKIQKSSGELVKDITVEELKYTLKNFKKKKSPGNNQVPIECIQFGSDSSLTWLTQIFNLVIRTRKAPSEWKESVLFTLYKGGDDTQLSTHCTVKRSIQTIYENTNIPSNTYDGA